MFVPEPFCDHPSQDTSSFFVASDFILEAQRDSAEGGVTSISSVTVRHPWARCATFKINLVEWSLAIANVACEVDLVRHWSLVLPFSYSAWDYFKSTVKFRTIKLQPELRFWPGEVNDGWFGGVHFGLAWYNLAIDGAYRKQDKDGHTPAVGGGISVGYRMSVSKNHHWKMEFSLGGGIYNLHYDTFHNNPDYHEGLLAYTKHKTYYGLDNVAVSLAYTFGLSRKDYQLKGGE